MSKLYEILLRLDDMRGLAGRPLDSLYAVHQAVTGFMADRPAGYNRDFLYVQSGDHLLVRSPREIANLLTQWNVLEPLPLGWSGRILGRVVFQPADSTRTRRDPAVTPRPPATLDTDRARRKLVTLLKPAFDVEDLSLVPLGTAQIAKPGSRPFAIAPMQFEAQVEVRSAEVAWNLLGCGIGRCKAFGYGMLIPQITSDEVADEID